MPRDKEQGVVDAYAEPDHGRDRWPDAGDTEQMPHEPNDGKRARQTEDRDEDRQTHCHEAAKHDRENHHCRRQADDLAAFGGWLTQTASDRASGLDLNARLLCWLPGCVQDLGGERLVDRARVDSE